MKKQICVLVTLLTLAAFVQAQSPNAIPYQAVARNTSGALISNQSISLRFTIHNGSAAGTVVYRETHNATTNALGLFSINIGEGTPVTGTFSAINWANGAKYTQIEMDVSGGTNYNDMGTQQMMSVPYAQYANNGMPPGISSGNMLYWNGTQWITVPPGINGQSLTYCNGVPTWGPCLPILTTNTVSQINFTSGYSGGNVSNDGGSPVSSRGLCWSTSPNPTTANATVTNGSGLGSFVEFASNLTPATTYYLRAFAINGAGTAYGNEVSFTTLAPTVPTMYTQYIYGTTYHSATAVVYVGSDGGQSIYDQGLCWATHQNPTITDFSASDYTVNPSSFTLNMYGLASGTTYYVRGWGTNSIGTGYGNELSFTTPALSAPVLTTTAMSSITSSGAVTGGNISSDGGLGITARGVCYNTSPNPTTSNSVVNSGLGSGGFACSLTGLATNTTYYVKAFATNSMGTTYGNQVTFTSSPYTLGQSFGGGKIFYIDGSTGQHGLIAALTDGPNSGNVNWYSGFPPLVNTGTAMGSGSANTTALVNALGTGSVAGLCRSYNGGGFNDWFLPSKDEVALMLQNGGVIGNISPGAYWSSSQVSQNIVWACGNTGTPFQVQQFGVSIYYYRAVRAF